MPVQRASYPRIRIQTPPSPCVIYCGENSLLSVKGFEKHYYVGTYLATHSYAGEGVQIWRPVGRERDRVRVYNTSGLWQWWSSSAYSWPSSILLSSISPSRACNRSLARISIASSGCSPRTF